MRSVGFGFSILLLASGLSHAQQMLTNTGFETGDFTGWSVPAPGNVACSYNQPDEHSGSYCFCEEGCCGSFGEVCAEQTVVVSPGTNYNVDGWMKGCGVATAEMYADGSTCASLGTPFGTNNDCIYTFYGTNVMGTASITLVLRSSGTGGAWGGNSVHWDDLAVGHWDPVGDWVLY